MTDAEALDPAAVERHLTRWPGRPTSGRYVYRFRRGGWFWQCDLHDICVASGRPWDTQREAFEDAVAHAETCPERNARW